MSKEQAELSKQETKTLEIANKLAEKQALIRETENNKAQKLAAHEVQAKQIAADLVHRQEQERKRNFLILFFYIYIQ